MHSEDQHKQCSKCGASKPLSEFSRSKDCLFGRRAQCKDCDAIYRKSIRLKDPETAKLRDKASRERNKESRREYAVRSYRENRDEIIKNVRQWVVNNPERVKQSRDKRYEEKRDEILEYTREYRKRNPEIIRAIARRKGEKLKLSPRAIVEKAMRSRLRGCIKEGSKGNRRTFELFGYTRDELASHLERQFLEGMTWDNYGMKGWHIDHIIPLSAFNYETPDDLDFKRAWALSNLQPLWAFDNISKGAKIKGGFQPSLALSIPPQQEMAA